MEVIVKRTAEALSREVTRTVPFDWGRSELTQFLDIAEVQAHASYVVLSQWVHAIESVDRNLTEQAPVFFHEIDPPRRTAAKLFLRSFGTFRGACRLALSGQTFEATVLTRSIIESAVYGWACAHSQAHRDAWEHRSDGDDMKQAARRLFRWSSLRELLREANADLDDRIHLLYEQTIECGAHPNIDGVSLGSEFRQIEKNRYAISTIFLHGEDAVLLAVLDLLRVMELVYRLLDLTIHDRLRILGVDQQVDQERQLVVRLISDLEREQREE